MLSEFPKNTHYNCSQPIVHSMTKVKGDLFKESTMLIRQLGILGCLLGKHSLRKHPFLLALRRLGRFARRNVCDSVAKIPYTDDANQCLHNKSGSHGVPNTNLYNFTCLLVDFGKFFCSAANELQENSNTSSREEYILQILTVLLEILRVDIWPLWPFVFCLSFVNNS